MTASGLGRVDQGTENVRCSQIIALLHGLNDSQTENVTMTRDMLHNCTNFPNQQTKLCN